MFDSKMIEELLNLCVESKNNDEIPVGAIIIDKNNNIIARSCNNRQKKCNVLGHAEINAIMEVESIIGDWRLDGYSMIVSLEPCEMCKAIIKESRIDKVYYLIENEKKSSIIIDEEIINGFEKEKSQIKALLTGYFKAKR